MTHKRFHIIVALLVLILLVASVLFGVLTYWLDESTSSKQAPDERGMAPAEQAGSAHAARRLAGGLEGEHGQSSRCYRF